MTPLDEYELTNMADDLNKDPSVENVIKVVQRIVFLVTLDKRQERRELKGQNILHRRRDG